MTLSQINTWLPRACCRSRRMRTGCIVGRYAEHIHITYVCTYTMYVHADAINMYRFFAFECFHGIFPFQLTSWYTPVLIVLMVYTPFDYVDGIHPVWLRSFVVYAPFEYDKGRYPFRLWTCYLTLPTCIPRSIIIIIYTTFNHVHGIFYPFRLCSWNLNFDHFPLRSLYTPLSIVSLKHISFNCACAIYPFGLHDVYTLVDCAHCSMYLFRLLCMTVSFAVLV